MALELATAVVRLRADSKALNASLVNAKRRIRTELGAMRVIVKIIPVINKGALTKIQTQLGAIGAVGGKGSGGAGGGKGGGGQGTARFIGGGGGGGKFGGQGAGGVNMSRNASIMSGASRVATGKGLMSGNIGGFAKGSFQIATGILGAQAALGALAVPVKAIQTAADFERSMIRVKAVTSATADEMERISRVAIETSKSTRFTASEVGTAMVVLGQKGLSAEDTATAAPVIIDLAAAGRVSPEQAATILVGITNAMQLGVDDLRDTADVLTRVAIGSSADLQTVGEAFKFVGPLAELAGMSIEEVSGSLALLSSVNLGGSIGGTGFKRIITTFANPKKTEQINKLLGTMIKFKDVDGNMRNLPDIIDDINRVLDKSSSSFDKAGFAVQVFGERAGPQFAAFLQKGGDALRGQIKIASDLGVTAKKVGDEDMKGLTGAFLELYSAIEALMIEVVNPFSDQIVGMTSNIKDAVNGISRWRKALEAIKVPQGISKMLNFFDKAAEYGLGPKALINAPKNIYKRITSLLPKGGKDINEGVDMDLLLRPAGGSGPEMSDFVAMSDRVQGKKNGKSDMADFVAMSAKVQGKTGMAGFVAMSARVQEKKKKAKEAEESQKGIDAAAAAAAKDAAAKKAAENMAAAKKAEERTSQFIGIEDFGKQIQLAILNKDKDKTQEAIAANSKKSSASLASIDKKIGDTVGVFG